MRSGAGVGFPGRQEVGGMMKTAAVGLLILLVAACSGTTEASTTSSGSSTSLVSTTSSVAGSTTAGPTITSASVTTDGPPVTLPPVIAEVAFAFASGDDPRVLAEVSVGESPEGPWLPAGLLDSPPTLTGPSFWVRFDITNTDQLNAVLTDLDLSGFDAGSFLGEDICELEEPLPRDGQAVCIIGEFPVQVGENRADFVVGGFGPRQGGPDRWYDPPLPASLEFGGARNSFALVFGTDEGLRVDGTADASEVQIDNFGISGSIRLDCSGSPFEGDPTLEAYVIENYSADGSPEGECSEIPTAELEFFADFDSDNGYSFFGSDGTNTTTFEATTTTFSAATTTTISG
jgi:hypothetical protein